MSTRIITTDQVQDVNDNALTVLINNLQAATAIQLANGAAAVVTTTYPILSLWYTAENIAPNTFPKIYCTDVGLCQWTGSVWAPLAPFNILCSGVPTGIASNGSVGVNGALTLTTALDKTYSLNNTGGCYLKFPSGALYAGSPVGAYYVIMSSTTAGTVYNNQYSFGNPVIPASPTPIVSASVGGYTQATGGYSSSTAVDLLNGILPANCTGLNGEIRISYVWTCSSSSGNKQIILAIGANNSQSFTYDNENTSTTRAATSYIRFQGATDGQVTFNNPSGDTGTGTGINYTSTPTGNNQTLAIRGLLVTAQTDWIMLQSATVQVTSSLLTDSPAPYQSLPAGNTVCPPAAAAAGFTQCAYFLRPQLTDVGFSNSTANALYTSGSGSSNANNFSMTSTPYTPSGQVLTILGGLGGNEYAVTNAQRPGAESVAGGIGTLGANQYLVPNTGFYAEWQFWCSDNFSDHWMACWMLPMEHNGIQGDRPPGGATGYEAWAEMDVIETGIWDNWFGQNWHGALQTLIDWHGYYDGVYSLSATPSNGDTSGSLANTWPNPTGYQSCNTSAGQIINVHCTSGNSAVTWTPALTGSPNTMFRFEYSSNNYHSGSGAAFDWTVPHTVGVLLNPSGGTIGFYFDGILQNQYTYPNYNVIDNYHYYQIVNAASNGWPTLKAPYYMYLGYLQAWIP